MRRKGLVLIGILVCSAVMAGSAQVFAEKVPGTIKIGGIYSLTGPDSNLGKQVEVGYKMSIEDINRDGGVYVEAFGKKIPLELVTLDMESSGDKAVARAETAYSTHKVIAYVGTTWIAFAAPTAEKNKIPMIPVASAGQSIFDRGFTYYFYPLATAPDLARNTFEVLDSVPEARRPKKLAIFEEQTEFGIEMSEFYQKLGREAGYEVVSIQKYAILSKDFSPQILAAKSAEAEAALSAPIMPDGMAMVRQMKELGYSPKANVMVRAATDPSWARAMGPLGDYVIVPTGGSHHRASYPGVADITQRHKAEFRRPPDPMVLPGYAVIQIIADAVKRAGTLDTRKIRDALAATDMMTVIGPVQFDSKGKVKKPGRLVLQWQNGEDELVWPTEFRTSPLVYPAPPWSKR